MNEILAQLIAAAIDAGKIPGLDCFDMTLRPYGKFDIILNDLTRLRITVEDVSEYLENPKDQERTAFPASDCSEI